MQQKMIANGGVQYVPQIAVQYVYLDFDGELTSYNGKILTVENVEVQNSSLTEERIADITAELNALYADQNVIFVTEKPEFAGYSTIFIGKTSAFDQYGNFAGLSETIDKGNKISTDNAFVMLDSTADNAQIISTISHETNHLLGTLDHGGEGLTAYAYDARYYVASGVTSSGVTLYCDSMYISKGGTANGTTVSSWGSMYISSGGVANDTTVDWGDMHVYSGGVANSTTVNSGGRMYISSGGTATNIIASSGAWLGITVAENTYIQGTSNGSAFEMKDAYISGYTVNYGCIYISSGGVANRTNVNSSGWMYISSGGVANSTTVNSGGCSMYISNGGTAIKTTVNWDSDMCIYSGGTATNIIASSGARLRITVAENTYIQGTSNGSAFEMKDAYISGYTVNELCYMYIESGGVANDTSVNYVGSMYIYSGGVANSTTLNHGGSMHISSGGVANNTTLSGGRMYISSGGVANDTSVNSGGRMYISSGGVANDTSVNSRGSMYISRGGVANSTTVNYWGKMYISNGVANNTTVNSEGSMLIYDGGVANDTTVDLNGRMYIYGGVANTTTVNSGGKMYITNGGVANDTTVNSEGYMLISSGGVANDTTLNSGGYMLISSGGVANSTTLNHGGSMHISSGGVHRGSLQIANGAVVSAYEDAIIDFMLTDRSSYDDYLINDLGKISGTPTYTITVSADQAEGVYKLAAVAENFTGTISIGTESENYGSTTVNGADFIHEGKIYSLANADGNLTLTVDSILKGNSNGISWKNMPGISACTVEYSPNYFVNSLQLAPDTNAVDTFGMPSGTYQCRVFDGETWHVGRDITAAGNSDAQQLVSDEDGNLDLFFADGREIWGKGYFAKHLGDNSTGEEVELSGKNRITDVFAGSSDANILVLTDDANGDALFLDDVYTALGKQARLSQINEIRAGAGNDIIDMTSSKFEYNGSEMTIYGGLGDDVIWAAGEDNDLFGDAGNDLIIGSTGFDLIIGGAGNDTMHTGGGGNDIFAFGENWGVDTVQLAETDESITLWFADYNGFWDAKNRIYRDGNNSVTISGGENCTIDLKFGNEGDQYEDMLAIGAFDSAASAKIFEDKNSGMLA